MEYVITFKNTSLAIKSEQYLLAEKLHVAVIPLPTQIGTGCGICLCLSAGEIAKALDILANKNIRELDVYLKIKEGRESAFKKIDMH